MDLLIYLRGFAQHQTKKARDDSLLSTEVVQKQKSPHLLDAPESAQNEPVFESGSVGSSATRLVGRGGEVHAGASLGPIFFLTNALAAPKCATTMAVLRHPSIKAMDRRCRLEPCRPCSWCPERARCSPTPATCRRVLLSPATRWRVLLSHDTRSSRKEWGASRL